jgi:CDP-diglyceride synthetase
MLYNIPVTPESTLFQITEVPDTPTVGALAAWIGKNPAGFIRYLGLAVFSTALAPYAWLLPGSLPEVARFETYMIAFPGMWLWYLVLPFSFLGMWEAIRRTRGAALPLIFYTAAIFLLVSVLIPREYRHRDMVMPFALMLAAEGLVFSRRWWLAGLIVWIPLIGFIAWKLHSILPLLLLVLAAAAAVILWHIRIRRRREDKMVRLV